MKVLIVDDEVEILEMLIENLQYEGFDVVGVTNAEDALRLSVGCTHALIDSLNKKGYPLAKTLRAQGIITFSFSGHNEIRSGEEDGFDGQINKPFDERKLLELLSKPKAA